MIDNPPQPPPPRPPPAEAENHLFDRWLREGLVRKFGKPGDQPASEALLRIIIEH